MAEWKYIKGSEADFEAYDIWTTSVWGDTETREKFGTVKEKESWAEAGGFHLIAQRERVTSINDDRLAQDVNALITERGNRYGKFKDGAEIMRDLKQVMHKVGGWNNLTASQKEALDMIQHKIGRILNGDPTYDDNWKDIAGYATLIVEELNGVSK